MGGVCPRAAGIKAGSCDSRRRSATTKMAVTVKKSYRVSLFLLFSVFSFGGSLVSVGQNYQRKVKKNSVGYFYRSLNATGRNAVCFQRNCSHLACLLVPLLFNQPRWKRLLGFNRYATKRFRCIFVSAAAVEDLNVSVCAGG